MAAAVDPLISEALLAAPQISDYPQFAQCEIPLQSGASRAFLGFIRPFSDDQTAREILRAVESNAQLQISSGRLSVETVPERMHPFEDYLIATAVPFTVLVAEFEGGEHPRSFLLSPKMTPRFSLSPHLRPDKYVWAGGRPYPALCVYSGNLFQYRNGEDKLQQLLDQTATYLAKYLIWLRTRQLFRRSADGSRQFVYKRKPHEPATEFDLMHARDAYWDGYWPGRLAPSGPAQHLATIKRTDECWCWSGKPYGDCCRPTEVAALKRAGSPVLASETWNRTTSTPSRTPLPEGANDNSPGWSSPRRTQPGEPADPHFRRPVGPA